MCCIAANHVFFKFGFLLRNYRTTPKELELKNLYKDASLRALFVVNRISQKNQKTHDLGVLSDRKCQADVRIFPRIFHVMRCMIEFCLNFV